MDAKPNDKKRLRQKDASSSSQSTKPVKQAKVESADSSKVAKDASPLNAAAVNAAKNVKTKESKAAKDKPANEGDGVKTIKITRPRSAKKDEKAANAKSKELLQRKKAKAESKTKPKSPVQCDLEKHCGVPLTNSDGQLSGKLCVRSLSCKTHSMSSKRAVVGRSKPFDVSFAAYQQRNTSRHAMAMYNNEQKRQDRLEAKENASDSDGNETTDANEAAAVLRGAMLSTPTPSDRKLIISTRLRTNSSTSRELLYKSMTSTTPPPRPQSGAPPIAAVVAATDAVFGRCVLFNPRTNHENIRPSQIQANAAINRISSKKKN